MKHKTAPKMVKRISALHDCARITIPTLPTLPTAQTAKAKPTAAPTLLINEIPNLTLWQISAWHDTLAEVAQHAARATNIPTAPAPGRAATAKTNANPNETEPRALLRIAPLQWWLITSKTGTDSKINTPNLTAQQGAILDLSHARTRIRISGTPDITRQLLNRHLPLDLRPTNFPPNTVASTAFHHTSITLWHSPHGFDLFIPRSFALALWEMLAETAQQFGDV